MHPGFFLHFALYALSFFYLALYAFIALKPRWCLALNFAAHLGFFLHALRLALNALLLKSLLRQRGRFMHFASLALRIMALHSLFLLHFLRATCIALYFSLHFLFCKHSLTFRCFIIALRHLGHLMHIARRAFRCLLKHFLLLLHFFARNLLILILLHLGHLMHLAIM